MSEKHLTELPWKKLVASEKIKDPGLLKALSAFAKLNGGKDPGAALKAVAAVAALAAKVKKANAKNKTITAYLDEIVKEVRKTEKALSAQVAASQASDEDDEDEGDDLLSGEVLTKTLKKIKSAPEGKTFSSMVCLAKPIVGLMVMKAPSKTLKATHKKMLKDATGGKKVLEGRCHFEDGALTFVLDAIPGGLAKKLKKAVKEKAGLMWKIRLRSLDGSIVIDDENDVDPDEEGTTSGAGDMKAFQERLKALKPELVKAIASHPDKADTLKKAAVEAGNQAQKGEVAKAMQLLEALEKSLASLQAPKTAKAGSGDQQSGPKPAPPPDQANDPAPPPSPAPSPPEPSPAPAPAPDPSASPPKPSKEQRAYDKALTAVNKLLAELNGHAHKAHVKPEIDSMALDITAADTAAKAGKFKDAAAAFKKATKTHRDAKKELNKYGRYIRKRSAAAALTSAMANSFADANFIVTQNGKITAADATVAPPGRDYTAAGAAVDAVATELAGYMKSFYIDENKKELAALKKLDGAKFVKEEIKEIEKVLALMAKNLKAKAWFKVILDTSRISSMLTTATKTATRRHAFDTQLPLTEAALAKVKKFKTLKSQAAAFATRLAEAKEQASGANRQFEIGLDNLKKIEKECNDLAALGADSDAYVKERSDTEKAFKALQQHKMASKEPSVLVGIDTRLDHATMLATNVDTVKDARAILTRIRTDLAAAKATLDGLKTTGDAVKGVKSSSAVKKAVAKLRKEAEKVKDEAAVNKEYKAVIKKLDEAEESAKEKSRTRQAITQLEEAKTMLTSLLAALNQHQRFTPGRKVVSDKLGVVKGLPVAASVQAKTDAVEKALGEADKHHKAKAWEKRAAALGKAQDAVKAAEEAAEARTAFEARKQVVETTLASSTLSGSDKGKVTAEVTKAVGKADTFDFTAADKLLSKADSLRESIIIKSLASGTPPDTTKIDRHISSYSAEKDAI